MIGDQIRLVLERIRGACRKAGRDPEEVTLIAVAKTFPSAMIREALREGVRDIGENYVQELLVKQGELRDESVRWHFIGHLQRNKVKSIVGSVHLIHSVDTSELGREISKRGKDLGRTVDVLVEVNTSGELTKNGVSPDRARDLVSELSTLPGIAVRGLMTIGPFLPDPEASRPAFASLRRLRDSLAVEGIGLPHLSMGMTNDLEVAVEEGATMVRVGTAIFGKRERR